MMMARDFPKLVNYDAVRAAGYSHEGTLELLTLLDSRKDDHEVFQTAYLVARKNFVSYETSTPEAMANDFLVIYRLAS